MIEETETAALIRRVLTGDGRKIREWFTNHLSDQLEEFVLAMAPALDDSGALDRYAKDSEIGAKVAWMVFSAVQGHLISMRLFLDGFLVQSGNAQRQVLESIAMALLCSKPDLGILQRFDDDTYKSNKAIRDAIKYADRLGVSKIAIQEIKKGADFYHDFSHPSKMTIALYSSQTNPDASYIGGIYDPAKLPQYQIEAESRVRIAKILPNFIRGVRQNLEGIH